MPHRMLFHLTHPLTDIADIYYYRITEAILTRKAPRKKKNRKADNKITFAKLKKTFNIHCRMLNNQKTKGGGGGGGAGKHCRSR